MNKNWNTIAARIVKNEGLLKSYNIALYDSQGNLRSTYDILKDLSSIWEDLSDTEKINIGQTLAGYWLACIGLIAGKTRWELVSVMDD